MEEKLVRGIILFQLIKKQKKETANRYIYVVFFARTDIFPR